MFHTSMGAWVRRGSDGCRGAWRPGTLEEGLTTLSGGGGGGGGEEEEGEMGWKGK